jgi:hypothetical protein
MRSDRPGGSRAGDPRGVSDGDCQARRAPGRRHRRRRQAEGAGDTARDGGLGRQHPLDPRGEPRQVPRRSETRAREAPRALPGDRRRRDRPRAVRAGGTGTPGGARLASPSMRHRRIRARQASPLLRGGGLGREVAADDAGGLHERVGCRASVAVPMPDEPDHPRWDAALQVDHDDIRVVGVNGEER